MHTLLVQIQARPSSSKETLKARLESKVYWRQKSTDHVAEVTYSL